MKKNKTSSTKIIIVTLAILLAVSVTLLVINLSSKGDVTNLNNQQVPKTDNNEEINFQEVHYLGNPEASVVMIEYSSITCPFCKRYQITDETFDNIKKEYVDTGKVVYIYKHFTRNEVDILGAIALECAGEQNMFFEYKRKVYENQENLQNLEFSNREFSKYAQELNLNMDSFNECLTDTKYLSKIESDKTEGMSKGITGTPGFLINGNVVSGAQPFAVFKAAIDRLL